MAFIKSVSDEGLVVLKESPPLPSVHEQLVLRAEKWLKSQNCGVVFRDEFRAATHSGEQPDSIGWRDGLSILIECKSSRSDFLVDKKKRFRKRLI